MLTSHSHRWQLRQNLHLAERLVASTWLCRTFPDTLSKAPVSRWLSEYFVAFTESMCERKRSPCTCYVKKKTQKNNSGSFGEPRPLRVSKKRLDKCPGPLRRVSLFTDSCSSGLLCAPLTCAETIMSSRGDNSLNIQKAQHLEREGRWC